MSIEAMKLALEALNRINRDSVSREHAQLMSEEAITALRQAIEQAEQAQPVAWMVKAHGVVQRLSVRADVADEYACQWRNSDPDADLYPLYTAPPQRKPLTEWQLIGTAPKTGKKVVLFYMNRNNLPRTVMARWLTDEQAAETDGDGVGLEGGWYECIDNWDDYTEVAIHEGEPSHWMPLPQPPMAAHGIRSNDAA